MYVGSDVHKNSINVAVAEAGGEVRPYGSIGGELKDLDKVIRKLRSQGSELFPPGSQPQPPKPGSQA
jgi:hypothetical protein